MYDEELFKLSVCSSQLTVLSVPYIFSGSISVEYSRKSKFSWSKNIREIVIVLLMYKNNHTGIKTFISTCALHIFNTRKACFENYDGCFFSLFRLKFKVKLIGAWHGARNQTSCCCDSEKSSREIRCSKLKTSHVGDLDG